MAATDRFRLQHRELVALAEVLIRTLDVAALAQDPGPARSALAKFLGVLKVHAAMENEALYPRLLQHDDAAVRGVAQRLLQDVEGIYDRVFAYGTRWRTPSAIADEPAAFANDTREVMQLLGERIRRETAELYPLADQLDPRE